jgi:ABC-type multidrug transport system fused ATPase/permease subunit
VSLSSSSHADDQLTINGRGESGGGKSSIHSLLLRYYDPIQGKITYDGKGM